MRKAPRILLVGEEHIREKVARHYDLLAELRGFETHYFVDDRSGISRQMHRNRPVSLHFAPNPSSGPLAVLGYWMAFVRCFETVKPDILEVYTGIHFAALLPMMLYAAARGVPRVVVCRGELYEPIYRTYSPFVRKSLTAVLRNASLIIYKEKYMDEVLERVAPGTPRLAWYNAIPIGPEPDYTRDQNVVLFLNFFKPWRNLDVIVRAAPRVRRAIPDVQFELVGGTDNLSDASGFYSGLHTYQETIEDLIHALGVQDFVKIRPFTSHVATEYARAKVYLLPADLVFCNYALLEAMERGVPPVVSADKDPDAREIVEDGVSGVVTRITPEDIGDAIVSLLADEADRQRIARNARTRIRERFGLQTMISSLADRYEELVVHATHERAEGRWTVRETSVGEEV